MVYDVTLACVHVHSVMLTMHRPSRWVDLDSGMSY